MTKPTVRDTAGMNLRLIQLESGDLDNATTEDILAFALRSVLSVVSEEAAVARHGLDLEDRDTHFTLCCATKIEIANKVIRAAQEVLDRLPPHVYVTEALPDREEVERYYDRKLTYLDIGLPGNVAAQLREQHIDAIMKNVNALREIAKEIDGEDQP